jgi:Ca-activated chloride channel family protein
MKKNYIISFIFSGFAVLYSQNLFAQKENVLINQGNQLYKAKKFDESKQQYQKAVGVAPGNATANYNLGNAEFRKNSYDDASKSYNASVEHAPDKNIQEKGYYNKGVALVKQQKTEESIDAWKNALKIDPNDEDARENLEKALLEKKSKQPKDQKNNQQQNKQKQNQQQQQQPQQPHSKLNKQQVEQLLKALQQRENDAQEKMNQNKSKSLSQPDKDW